MNTFSTTENINDDELTVLVPVTTGQRFEIVFPAWLTTCPTCTTPNALKPGMRICLECAKN